MQEKTKNVLIAVLIVGLVSMTVAYAAFSTTLTISSSAKVNNTKWDVKIKNFTQAAAQPNNVSGTSEATVKSGYNTSGTTIEGVEVTFKKPGDVVKFTFDLVNEGDINAKLDSFTLGQVTANTDVVKAVKCGSTPADPVPATTSNAMNLAKTNGTISCYMTITLSNNATIPTGANSEPLSVTIPNTVFNYSQN